MKLNFSGETVTNCQIESQVFRIEASPIAFEILSSKLYANPILAIVRELLTNAYDSHKAANNLHIPIKVHFPNYLDKNFSIRDFGLGLSKEDVMEMYTSFFRSTKSTTNEFTGCFGLGSKTPFSYTSAFSVNSFYNGIKYYFAAVKKDGQPHIICVKEELTDEPNGLEIIIPTNSSDNTTFIQNAREYLYYMPEIILDTNQSIDRGELLYELDNIKLYKNPLSHNNWFDSSNQLLLKQGQNIYSGNEFVPLHKIKYLHKIRKKFIVVIEVPIGTLEITPSRESLSKEVHNVEKINKFIQDTEANFANIIQNNTKLIQNWDHSTYDEIVSEKYFPNGLVNIRYIKKEENFKDICQISMGYVNPIKVTDRDKWINATFFSSNKIVVFCYDTLDAKEYQKLKNRIKNYNLNEVFILFPTRRSEEKRDFLRRMFNIFWILNEIHEYDFNFNYMTMSKFNREYPNSKEVKQKTKNLEKTINITVHTILFNAYDSTTFFRKKQSNSLKFIYENYPCETTFVIEDNQKNFDVAELPQLICTFVHRIVNHKAENFVLNYLFNINNKLNKDIISARNIHMILISKSNLRFFKDYVKFDINNFNEMIEKENWKITASPSSSEYSSELCSILTKYRNTLKVNFIGKVQNLIKDSNIYKYIDTYINSYESLGISKIKNFCSPFHIRVLNKWKLLTTNREHKNENYFSEKIRTLESIIEPKQTPFRSHAISKKGDKNNFRHTKVMAYHLNNDQKIKILKFLTKENKPNVIFQR